SIILAGQIIRSRVPFKSHVDQHCLVVHCIEDQLFFWYIKSSDFREQFDEVLRLRAALSTEVEALEQLRAELEDSESMSEVHIQLERATLENKRLQSAVRVAHEQVSDLFFSKRVLEAEMSALRSERDRQLAEANERVRLAERAVVAAATSRRRFTEPIATKSPVLTSRSGSHSGTGSLTESSSVPLLFGRNEDGTESIQHTPDSNSRESTEGGPTTVIATGSIVSKPQVTNFRQPLMGFKIAGHKRKVCVCLKLSLSNSIYSHLSTRWYYFDLSVSLAVGRHLLSPFCCFYTVLFEFC
ncbi:Pericentrin, partial [Fasciola gigantica]